MRKIVLAMSGTGLASVLASVGWPALVLTACLTVIVVCTLCWVISDLGRAERLALLIGVFRSRSGPVVIHPSPAEITPGVPPEVTKGNAGAARADAEINPQDNG